MAEIKRMNSALSMAGTGYVATAMEQIIEQEKTRRRSLRLEAVIRRYWTYGAAALVVFAILLQSITIYAMQRSLSATNGEILQLQRTNETLRVAVLKARDLDQTKQEAMASQYVARSSVAAWSVDLDADNFTGQSQPDVQVSWWGGLFAFFE